MSKRQRVADRHPGGTGRNADLARIHMLKSRHQLADDSYRGIIRSLSNRRTDSSADLTQAERRLLIAHLTACGDRPAPSKSRDAFPDTDQWRLAWSLWQQLADAKKVTDRRRSAFATFARKQIGVDALMFCPPEHIGPVIESLKAWLAR